MIEEPLPDIASLLFRDENQDGIQNSDDYGMSGIPLSLFEDDGTFVKSTSSRGNGAYEFFDVSPGSYYVQVDEPAGFDFTDQDVGNDDTVDSDVDTITGQTEIFVFTQGSSPKDYDAGLVWNGKGIIGDYVWNDANSNGIQDDNESGMADIPVFLRDATDTIIDTTTTNAEGFYSFEVDPGDYYIEVVAPLDYEFSPQYWGESSGLNSDIDPDSARLELTILPNGQTIQTLIGKSDLFTLESAEYQDTVDAGLVLQSYGGLNSSISGEVWDDVNKNGIHDVSEPNVTDVIVALLDEFDNHLFSMLTDANGGYLFDEIP